MPSGGVHYCDSCSRLITPEEEKTGALLTDKTSLCRACASQVPEAVVRRSDPVMRAVRGNALEKRPRSVRSGPSAPKSNLTALLVVGIFVGVAAGAGVILAVDSGKAEVVPVVAVKPPATPDVAKTPAVPSVPAPGPVVPSQVREGPRREFQKLLAMRDPDLTRYDEIRSGIMRLMDRSHGSDLFPEMRSALGDLDLERGRLADAELARIRARAIALASEGKGDAGLKLLKDFAERQAAGPWMPSRGREAIAAARAEVLSTPIAVVEPGQEIVIQYTGEDKYESDRLPGLNMHGPVKDTMLLKDKPTDNGMRSWFEIRVMNHPHGVQYSLIAFKLPAVPAGSVASARMELFCYNVPSGPAEVTAHPMLKSWGTTDLGAAYDSRDPNVPWNPGSGPTSLNPDPAATNDFDGSRGITALVSRSDEWSAWNVTDFVRSWLDGSLKNNGLILVCHAPNSIARFYSSNLPPSEKRPNVADFRPRLVITLKR